MGPVRRDRLVVPRSLRAGLAVRRGRLFARFAPTRFRASQDVGRGPSVAAPCWPVVAMQQAFDQGRRPPDVLALGDSTSVLVGQLDFDWRSLESMLSARLWPRRVLGIGHFAYNSDVFAALLDAQAIMGRHPKVVTLPVNVRQFGPEWTHSPNQTFADLIDATHAYVAEPSAPLAVLEPYPRGNLLRGDPDSPAWQAFQREPVHYVGRPEATIGDFLGAIERGRRDTPEDRRRWLELIFTFHYLYELDERHPRFASLAAAIATCRDMGVALVIYVTPVNHEAGRELLGPDFEGAVRQITGAVRRVVEEAALGSDRIVLEDWSMAMPPDLFLTSTEVLGHLNDLGRRKLASALATRARALASRR